MSKEYYKTAESVKEYIRAAQGYDGRKLITRLKNYLPARSTLLEIGSGPGTDWSISNSYFERVIGSDNSPEFLKRLRKDHPEGEFFELDATSLNTDETFDAIYSNKVLHHLSDIELKDSFKRQSELLVPHGVICHSFWRGEGSEEFKGLLVNYHTQTELQGYLEPYFRLLYAQEYTEFEKDDSLLIIAVKN